MDFGRVEVELRRHPALVRHWDAVSAAVKADAPAKTQAQFLPSLLAHFLDVVEGAPADPAPLSQDSIVYCERFVELLSDLMSQLGTRRFFRLVVLDQHTVVRCRRSALIQRAGAKLFRQLVDVLAHYQDFEIDDHTGLALTLKQMEESHYHRIQTLQRIAYKHFREALDDFALKNVGAVSSKEQLLKYFGLLSDEQLVELAAKLRILPRPGAPAQPGLVTRLPALTRDLVTGACVCALLELVVLVPRLCGDGDDGCVCDGRALWRCSRKMWWR